MIDANKNTKINKNNDCNKIDDLNNLIKDLNITKESVENYYVFGDKIGSGKYGVVKLCTSGN